MIDPVTANGVRPPQELYGQAPVDVSPGQVSSADEVRFEALSTPRGVEAIDEGNVRVAQAGEDVWVRQPAVDDPSVPPPPTLGENILNGMENLRNSWSETMSEGLSTAV